MIFVRRTQHQTLAGCGFDACAAIATELGSGIVASNAARRLRELYGERPERIEREYRNGADGVASFYSCIPRL